MKKALSLLLMLALLLSLFAGMGVLADEEAPAALEIYTQAGEGEPALSKAYSAEDLAALAETAEGYAYPYFKGDAMNATVATEYVTLSALLADAGVAFGEGDKLSFICSDGPYTKGDFSFENIDARGLDHEGNPVPTGLAITWDNGNLEEGSVADIAAGAKNTGNLRFVCGATAEELEAKNAAGNRMPSGVVAITVVSPVKPALEIYAQVGEGEPVLAKAYMAEDLAALAETAEGYAYPYFKGDAMNATVATEYVTLSALLADAGVSFAAEDKLAFTCDDGPYTKGDFSFENIDPRGLDHEGNPVPTGLAITWDNGNLDEGTVADIAAGAKNTGRLRFVCGATAEELEAKNAAGNRMPSGVVAITVVSPLKPALTISTQAGKGADVVVAKAYTADELAALAEKTAGYAYPYFKGDAMNATVATEYVTLSALLTDAGVAFGEGDKLSFICDDGPYFKGDFSFKNIDPRGLDHEGNPVPTGLAITWDNGNLDEGTVAGIAAGARNSGRLRFVCGATAEELEGKNAAGNRMPTGVIEITIVTAPKVRVTNQGLKVNGEDKSGDIYNISGRNYFKLRDLAMLLNGTSAQFSVDFDTENSIVYVTPGEAYTPVGGELTAGEDRSASCVESRWTLRIGGGNVDIAAYNMGGNNYFQLKQLGEVLGFGVDYDEATRTMLVTSK